MVVSSGDSTSARAASNMIAVVDGALPVPRTRADDVVKFVEAKIKQFDLQPGERIGTRADLRNQTGVARTTVNEAIRLLQERQTVSLRPGPGGGLFVAAPNPVVKLGRTLLAVKADPSTVAGAIEVREHLESLIARHAALHRNRGDIKELGAMVSDLTHALDDPVRFSASMVRLHSRIAAVSPNPVLRTLYTSLYDWVHEVSRVESLPADPQYIANRLGVHRDLVEAIVAGDADSAEAAGIAHAHGVRRVGQ